MPPAHPVVLMDLFCHRDCDCPTDTPIASWQPSTAKVQGTGENGDQDSTHTVPVSSSSCASAAMSTTSFFSSTPTKFRSRSQKRVENFFVLKIIPEEPFGQRSGNQDNRNKMTTGYL